MTKATPRPACQSPCQVLLWQRELLVDCSVISMNDKSHVRLVKAHAKSVVATELLVDCSVISMNDPRGLSKPMPVLLWQREPLVDCSVISPLNKVFSSLRCFLKYASAVIPFVDNQTATLFSVTDCQRVDDATSRKFRHTLCESDKTLFTFWHTNCGEAE